MGLLRGVRPVDLVTAAVLSALGVVLMVENIVAADSGVRVDSHSWWSVPVFLAATVPVVWWRRAPLLVIWTAAAAMGVHVLLFGAMVRCGAGLPLAFVLAFVCGSGLDRRRGLLGLVAAAALSALVLVQDTAAGLGILPVVLALLVMLWGIGVVVQQRSGLTAELGRRNAELRALRDERAALEVSDDRAVLSEQLGTLLDQRLSQLAATAEAGADADGSRVHGVLVALEEDSRRTLGDMREIVGLLRGGEASTAPSPTVAHLDALLARRLGAESRLRVEGDPRLLPASVELSAYRIVEHVLSALADDQVGQALVSMRFDADALEIVVSGRVHRGADLRAAVVRARERARLHAGSLDADVSRGRARVVAHLPLASGA